VEVPQILFIWSGKISGANIDWRLQEAVGKFVQLPVHISVNPSAKAPQLNDLFR
jgi:hypothetical protein